MEDKTLRKVSVESVADLIRYRRRAVVAGRETRPWRAFPAKTYGLYDPDHPDGPVLYTITAQKVWDTWNDPTLPETVRAALQRTEGWEALFGGPIMYFD